MGIGLQHLLPDISLTGVDGFLSQKNVEIALEPSVTPGLGASCDLMSAPRQSQLFRKAVEMCCSSSVSEFLNYFFVGIINYKIIL